MITPYILGFALALSGMLIGYFVKHQNNRREASIRDELIQQNKTLKSSLHQSQLSYTALDDRFSRQRAQMKALQQLCDDWTGNRDQAERERVELEVQVSERKKRLEEVAAELETAKTKSIQLEDQLHHDAQEHLKAIGDVENRWLKKHSQLTVQCERYKSELQTKTDAEQTARQKLHRSEARIAELEAGLRANDSILNDARNNVSGLEKEYTTLESALDQTNGQLVEIQGQLAVQQSEKASLQDALTAANATVEQLRGEISQLTESKTDLQTKLADADSTATALVNANRRLEEVTQQRDAAIVAQQETQTTIQGLQVRIDNQESTIHRLRRSQDDALENLKHELKVRSEIEQKFDVRLVEMRDQQNQESLEKSAAIEQLKTELKKQHTAFTDQVATAQGRAGELQRQRDQLKIEREQLRDENKQLQQQIGDLQTSIIGLEKNNHQLAERSDSVKSIERQLEEAKQAIGNKDEHLKRLQAESSELARLRAEHSTSVRRQAELQSRLDAMMTSQLAMNDRGKSDQENCYSITDAEIKQLRRSLDQSEMLIAELRKDQAAMSEKIGQQVITTDHDSTVISFTQAMQQRRESTYSADYGGRIRRDESRGVVFTEAPESKDDLKRISGIATVLESRLNECGIYTFKQIMDWNQQEIEEFSRLLAFKDRIQRDDWQGQARTFYQQKRQSNTKIA